MARSSAYKQYNRQERNAILDEDFSKGMMSTQGIVDEGYVKTLVNFTYEKETSALTPRPGLVVDSVIFPDINYSDAEFLSSEVNIKASKECIENGVQYNQLILGKLDEDSVSSGKLWISTSLKETSPVNVEFSDEYSKPIRYSEAVLCPTSHKCNYYTVGDSSIHKVPLQEDIYRRIGYPVGTFAFGNSYYFFGEDSYGNKGLFKTVFNSNILPARYMFEAVEPKELSVSEAVTYGYNMLLGSDAYSFQNQHTAALMEFEGILPYDPSSGDLLMSPRRNQPIDLVCFYNAPTNRTYDIIWEWRETTASSWTLLQKDVGVTLTVGTELKVSNFKAPAKDIMIRIAAYPYVTLGGQASNTVSDTVEKAMVVGFDFTLDSAKTNSRYDQEVYDLSTASGLTSWNGRLVAWGVPEDPTILFISDYNNPSYFPYPNNIVVFDAPIIKAMEFMDGLVVFTTDKLYQVTTASDGNSWQSTVLQSHLYINAWDRHLIQTVRNMLYFKSGNYYYMMVPKAQSLTGELTLAPITTPITSFFDNFSVNVQDVLKNTYGYLDMFSLLTYYNYLDYEDVHNIYILQCGDSSKLLHFDVMYNTVDRTWKVWTYETPNMLFPHRHDATQTGILASSSLFLADDVETGDKDPQRIIQFYTWDKSVASECYVPVNIPITFNPDMISPILEDGVLTLPEQWGVYESEALVLVNTNLAYVNGNTLVLQGATDYFSGFSVMDINRTLTTVFNDPDDYFNFRNYQFLDTGYREDNLHMKKRYREIQLQLNNLDKKNLDFGLDCILDGAVRKLLYKYDVTQIIDEFNPEYGIAYIDTVPFMEVALDDIDLSNQWTIDQGLYPDITLWKMRVAVSGKGSAPRLKLYSRNDKRFELLSINWVSRSMHMR